MNITSIEKSVSEIVETDGEEFPIYRRHEGGTWEQLMGESWETVYTREEELEEMYQNYTSCMKSAWEWSEEKEITIIDPDGWRNDNKSLQALISEEEYNRRVSISTITPSR